MIFMSISLMANGDEHLFMFFEHMCALSCELIVVVVIIIRIPHLAYNLLCVRNCCKQRTALNPKKQRHPSPKPLQQRYQDAPLYMASRTHPWWQGWERSHCFLCGVWLE